MRSKLGFVLLLILFVAACGQSTTTVPPTPDTSISGRLTFAGSTTVQPLADALARAFRERYPNVVLEIAAGGTQVGIDAIHDGTVDLGMASRSLSLQEAVGITQHQIAVDVIAIVAHSSNPVKNLTLDQLRGIYLGQLTAWNQVGGPERKIVAVVRGKNSGTRGAFDELVLKGQDPAAPGAQIAVTAGDVAAMVLDDPNAIGYVGFGNLEPGLDLIVIDGVAPDEETVRNNSYPLVRPLLLLTGPLSQPLALKFVEWATSQEGQQIVAASGWVPAKPH